ncbi:MAG: hypothetical protein KatS3mg111_2868 [Pirellulaceae bacterium]|nr:MAG: hypothetical protein KatS3mg111_2868 [Pirellulaceae bacterium]
MIQEKQPTSNCNARFAVKWSDTALRWNHVVVWCFIAVIGGTCWAEAPGDGRALKPLFDGKTLQGWEGNAKYFRVEDGCIVAGTLKEPIPHNEFLCTEREFADFELIVEVQLRGEGNNAGIQFRSQRIAGSTEVRGYQCDVGEAWGRPVWGALYDESRRNTMLAEGPAEKVRQWLREDDWNELRVVAVGNRIMLYLNGHLTVDYRERDPQIPRTGIIGLQIHSGPPTEAWYRNIRLRELTLSDTQAEQ